MGLFAIVITFLLYEPLLMQEDLGQDARLDYILAFMLDNCTITYTTHPVLALLPTASSGILHLLNSSKTLMCPRLVRVVMSSFIRDSTCRCLQRLHL